LKQIQKNMCSPFEQAKEKVKNSLLETEMT